ncbi:Lrr-containing protein, partial [Globisporangium splendens]
MAATRLYDAAPDNAITTRTLGTISAPFPTALDLRGNRFETAGAKRLAELLRMQHNVVSISLERNNVGVLDEGIEAITVALEVDTRLMTLDLRNNNISLEGAKALPHALMRNRTLKQLDLRRNDIANAGVLAFREALQSNHSLLHLELMGNNSSLKHADEIEKLPVRNRAFQGHQQQPPSVGTVQEVPKAVVVETKQDDQLLLQILAEKESLESELSLARKEIHKMKETLEENDMHLKMLCKEAETLKEDRNRHQQREIDAKRETHELKMQSEELENKRKIEFEEYRAARTALERDVSVMRDKMSHSEAMQSKVLEQKNQQVAQLEDHKYTQDSEVHKLNLTMRLQQKGRRMDRFTAEHAGCAASPARIGSPDTRESTQSCESAARRQSTDSDDAQGKSGDAAGDESWETELQERIQRAVGLIEAQVEDVKQGRLHLEREVEKHMDTILRLRQENLVVQKASDEKHASLHQELEKQYKELQEKQDLCAAVTKERRDAKRSYKCIFGSSKSKMLDWCA